MPRHDLKTLFTEPRDIALLVAKIGIEHLLRKVTENLQADFSRWEEFEKCPRTANHSPIGVIELMPISDHDQFGFKYVNGHPQNPALDLTTVMAFGAIANVNTGYPIFISEMTLLTALRTAATSVLAAKYLARKNSKSMAMIGNGAQSEFQIIAFYDQIGIRSVRLYDVDSAATDKLIRNLSHFSDLELIKCNSTSEAVQGVDIISTCTADKCNATIISADQVAPGMHINGIGGDCPGKTELDAKILTDAKVVVEYAPQSRIEGDIQQMPKDFPVTELWEIINGMKSGRESDQEVTVFDSVGFALEDYSVLRTIYHLSKQYKIGQEINVIPELDNVKDLYGYLNTVAPVNARK